MIIYFSLLYKTSIFLFLIQTFVILHYLDYFTFYFVLNGPFLIFLSGVFISNNNTTVEVNMVCGLMKGSARRRRPISGVLAETRVIFVTWPKALARFAPCSSHHRIYQRSLRLPARRLFYVMCMRGGVLAAEPKPRVPTQNTPL